MSALRRFSYLLVSLFLVVAAAVATLLLNWGVAGQIGTLILAAVLMIYWVGARRGAVTPADPDKKLRRARGGGRPVVLYFYSDFSLTCLLRRPGDSRVQKRFSGRCEFIAVSVFHRDAGAMMKSMKAGLGDYLFFDMQGKLSGKARTLSEDQLNRLLETAL
jgi:hypothetical protein